MTKPPQSKSSPAASSPAASSLAISSPATRDLIRQARQAKDCTQEHLASSAKLSVSTIAKIESGKQTGSRRAMRAIAAALGLKLNADGRGVDPASASLASGPSGAESLGVFSDVATDVVQLANQMRYPADMLASIALKWFCHQPRDAHRRILAEAAPLMVGPNTPA